MSDLNKKIDFAIKLLQSIPQDGTIELSYSGGKDSDVILELARMSGIPFEAIYKNTTIDPPYTIKHCKDNGVKIVNPKQTFFQLIREQGYPTRFKRFCCSQLKEYKIHDRAIQGIRRSESNKRAERYKEPEYCRTYSAKEKVRIYLPILEWSNEDVEQFIKERNIKCHPLYYNEFGEFDVKKRLGCIGCPLASKKIRRLQFMKYPKMLKLWIKNHDIYLKSHTKTKVYQYCNGNAYNSMMFNLFFDRIQDYKNAISGGMFHELSIDSKQFLEDYFKIDLAI